MKRTGMRKIKEIIRINEQNNLSIRQISKAVNLSRPVVSKLISRVKATNLSYNEIQDLNQEEIYELLYPEKEEKNDRDLKYAELSARFDYFLKELQRPHVTLQKLWEEYIEEIPDGYSRSQFFEHFSRWRKATELSMHIEHKAGDKVFIDFTGKKLYLCDKETGIKIPVETFIAILPCSGYTFVCATMTQKTEDWIKGTEEAFWYFGGSTTAITPDCFKSAVKKADCYDPEINPEYGRFTEHYNTVVLPARPAHPKDKALVENAVKIVYHRIYASLRNNVFYSLTELNKAILQELEKYNNRKMQKSCYSRAELFKKIEQNQLKPLPIKLYESIKFSKTGIQSNYHVYLSEDKCCYSVPFRYYGQSQQKKPPIKAEIHYSKKSVEIYFQGERIAVHKRDSKKKYVTEIQHMPQNHQKYVERYNPEKTITLAQSKGENVALIVNKLIAEHQHPEQSYKICKGLLSLGRNYGYQRLDKACYKALKLGYISFKTIKTLLENNQENLEESENQENDIPEHNNIRGKDYFNSKLKENLNEQ